MSVTYQTVSAVSPHPRAGHLEVVGLVDLPYQFIVPKGAFAVGAKAFYFPAGSVMPEALIKALGLTGKLADGNRIAPRLIHGEWSGGVIADPDEVLPSFRPALGKCWLVFPNLSALNYRGKSLTEVLGVTESIEPAVVGESLFT